MEFSQPHEDLYADEKEEAKKLLQQQTQANEDRVRAWVYPLICNMGSFQTIGGRKIYLADPQAGRSLKKLSYEMWKPKELDRPFIRYFLLEWNFISDNLLPLLHTQQEDKKLLSEAMRLLWVMSADFNAADLAEFGPRDEFLRKRQAMSQLLHDKSFIELLVKEIELCASAGKDMFESQRKMLRFIFGTVLNLMRLDVGAMLSKIVSIFAMKGGLFDSIVYFTQNSEVEAFRDLYPTFGLILHRLSRFVNPRSLFGASLEKDPEFRRRMDMEKLMKQRRKRNVISSRHSRFGAMISVKRKDNTSLIVSNPNSLHDREHLTKLNRRQGQLRKRLFGAYQQSVLDKKRHPDVQNLAGRKQVDGTVVHHVKAFLRELLNFGFVNLATYLEQSVFSLEQNASGKPSENTVTFVELMSFVMECVLVMR